MAQFSNDSLNGAMQAFLEKQLIEKLKADSPNTPENVLRNVIKKEGVFALAKRKLGFKDKGSK